MTATELAAVLESRGLRVRARRSGQGFMAQCPAHGDGRHLSLAVSTGQDGRQLLHCFAGCDFEKVRRALGLARESFAGWDPYYHQRLQRAHCGLPSLTLSLCSHPGLSSIRVVDARALAAPAPAVGTTVEIVAADLAALFVAADRAGAGGYPLMYSARFGAERTGRHQTAVAKALRTLVRTGRLTRGPDIPTTKGRSARTYRRTEP